MTFKIGMGHLFNSMINHGMNSIKSINHGMNSIESINHGMNSMATRSVVPMALGQNSAIGTTDFVAQGFNPEILDSGILDSGKLDSGKF